MKKKHSLLFCLGLVLAGCGSFGPGSGRGEHTPSHIPGTREWYESSTPIVKEYLTTLPDDAIGRPLDGIRLSDGGRWFEGYTYLGRPRNLPPQLRVTMMRVEGRVVAFMWVEEGGEPFALAACEGEDLGIRARRLEGTVLAWQALRPEHGVVSTPCPPEAWLPASDGDD